MESAIKSNGRHSRPRIRTIILMVGLFILLLPLGGMGLFRIYENQLIRSTEAELIAQSAVVRSLFINELRNSGTDAELRSAGRRLSQDLATYYRDRDREPFNPIFPELDLRRDRIREPSEEGIPPIFVVDSLAEIAGARLIPVLKETQRSTLAGVRVVDIHGIVIATTRSEMGLSIAHREEVAEALRGKPARLIRAKEKYKEATLASISRATTKRVVVSLPIVWGGRLYGAVIASRTPVNVTKDLFHRRNAILAMLGTLAIVVLIVAIIIGLFISRPIYRLVEQSRKIIRGDDDATEPLTRPGTFEVAELSNAMAKMARILQTRADYIQSFARSVSHEFKTPLTSIDGAVEILGEHFSTMSEDERRKFLGIIKAESGQMSRLVSKLLQLARADVVTPGEGSCLVQEVVRDLETKLKYQQKDLTLKVDPSVEQARLPVEREVMFTIVSNLVENAFQHAGEGARVVFGVRKSGAGVELFVEDNGAGISPANLERIMDPFFTTAQNRGGTGLGLTITNSLIKAHGGEITVASEEGKFTRVTIKLH